MKAKYKDQVIEIRPCLHSTELWVSPEVGFVKKSEVETLEEKEPEYEASAVSNIFVKVPLPVITAEIDIEKP